MKITYKLEAQERKTLVKAIALQTGLKAEYLAMPSAAYQIGPFHVAKDSTVTGPDDRALIEALRDLHSFVPESEEYDAPEADPAAEQPKVAAYVRFSTEEKALGLAEDPANEEDTAAPAKPDKTGLPKLYTLITPRGEIFITEEFATHDEAAAEGYDEAFSTALGTVYSYGDNRTFALVTAHKAGDWDTATIGRDFREAAPGEDDAPEFPTEPELDRVVIEMPLADFTPQALDNLCKMVTAKEEPIKLAIDADALPIQVLEDRIAFPWLQTADPELVDALATFISALCRTAREKKRVTATPQPTGVNDRYRFCCFMLHIGMIGPEYATARTTLLRPLSGNSGWLNGPPEKAPAEAPEEAPAAEEIPAEEQAPETDPATKDAIPAEEPAAEEEAPAPQEENPAAAPAEETEEAEAHD
jgi:hypothetical protein